MRWLPSLLLLGCTPSAPDRFLVVDGFGGDYDLVESAIPELDDPYRMRGALGNGSVGGYIALETDRVAYRRGGSLGVDYTRDGDLGLPLDADGLALWSFYHSLSSAREQLDGVGFPTNEVFPVDFAFQPTVGGDSLITSNAAYVAGGAHVFALLADPPNATLPLAANPMVIRHELGHALFQRIVLDDVRTYDPTASSDLRISALNEGFADMVASLLLDDPDILGASIPNPSIRDGRLLTGPHSTATALPLDDDFYSRGTVYASFTWDLRQGDDRLVLLQDVFSALEELGDASPWLVDDRLESVDRFAELLLERVLARRPSEADALCDAYASRFPDLPEPDACSSL